MLGSIPRPRTMVAAIPAALALAGLIAAPGCGRLARRPAEHASARLLEAPPENGGKVSHRQAADVQVALGRSLEAENQPAGAEDAYRRALDNDPKRADAHARLAVLLDAKGDFAAADKQFAEAIRLDPRNPDWRCDRGYHYAVQRRWAEAESLYREAIKLDRRHPRAHNNLGMALAHRGDEAGALAEFERAGLRPSDAQANLGLILAAEGQAAEAEAAYARAVRANPKSEAALQGQRALVAARTAPPAGPGAGAEGRAIASATRVDPAVRPASLDLPPLP